ncbi:MAG TPA: HEAT repeat domain-containing protein [Chryseosolibacter sp.]
MNEAVSNLFGHEALATETLIILYIAFTFFAAGIGVVVILFGSRLVKTYYEGRSQDLSRKLQGVLNSIIVNAAANENAVPDPAFQFHLQQIELLVTGSDYRKQLLINQLIRLKKNLTGASADSLRVIYQKLSLHKVSLKGLKTFRWFNKARAMRELSEMGVRQSAPLMAPYLRSRNSALREEAFISMANLTADQPLEFLDDYKFAITDWMQLNVYNVLQRTDTRDLPDFSRWFMHTNKSVRLFAIRMAAQFRQYQAAGSLRELLSDPDPDVQYQSMKAVADLELDQLVDDVLKLKAIAWKNPELAKIVVKYFGRVVLTPQTENVLREFMSHEDYAVRFEATSSLLRNSSLGLSSGDLGEKSQRIIRHLSEPLLK